MKIDRTKKGVLCAVIAFSFWGVVPIFWKQLITMTPSELLFHRSFWGFLVLGSYLFISQGWRELGQLQNPKIFLAALSAAALIIVNWWTFVWAAINGHILEASLGYFLCPLLSVFLSTFFLGEKLNLKQKICVFLAGLGLFFMFAGEVGAPWVALSLAMTFALYGFVRKQNSLGPIPGLAFEMAVAVLVTLPFLGGAIFLDFPKLSLDIQINAIIAGLVTIFPLVFYNRALKLIRYSTVAMLQFLGPSLQFALAVMIFGEKFTLVHGLSFALIWLGVGLYLKERFSTSFEADES